MLRTSGDIRAYGEITFYDYYNSTPSRNFLFFVGGPSCGVNTISLRLKPIRIKYTCRHMQKGGWQKGAMKLT
jgi:hypothetical protein